MVSRSGINVGTDDVHYIVTRVPAWIDRVPDPEKVVKAMIVRHPVVHEAVKTLAGIRAFGSPPEPATFSLVQRSPEDGNVGGLQAFQLRCDGIDVSY